MKVKDSFWNQHNSARRRPIWKCKHTQFQTTEINWSSSSQEPLDRHNLNLFWQWCTTWDMPACPEPLYEADIFEPMMDCIIEGSVWGRLNLRLTMKLLLLNNTLISDILSSLMDQVANSLPQRCVTCFPFDPICRFGISLFLSGYSISFLISATRDKLRVSSGSQDDPNQVISTLKWIICSIVRFTCWQVWTVFLICCVLLVLTDDCTLIKRNIDLLEFTTLIIRYLD